MINHRGHREHGVKEFASPFEEYKQTRSDSKQALLRRQIAEGSPWTASRAAEKLARLKLNDESHSRLGAAIGAGIGVVPGFALGLPRGNAASIAWGALTGLAGAGIGQAIGGSIRKNKDKNLSANLKPALRELAARSQQITEFAQGQYVAGLLGIKNAVRLAARSGRIVEFGDGDADKAVLSALKAVASADESSAQRAMLLKRGLIEMVKGQVVITERGYEMMQKAGVPPKLTPEERREEIVGTEEKRLSMFDHRGHREHRVELARGDYLNKLVHIADGPEVLRRPLRVVRRGSMEAKALAPYHRAALAGLREKVAAAKRGSGGSAYDFPMNRARGAHEGLLSGLGRY